MGTVSAVAHSNDALLLVLEQIFLLRRRLVRHITLTEPHLVRAVAVIVDPNDAQRH